MMPSNLPYWVTVYHYFRKWRKVAGFDPSGGDWQYALFERGEDGQFTGGWMGVESAAMCIGCHVNAQAKDFTFLTYLSQ
jgi:hypothetical protein